MAPRKILLLGANGQVGWELSRSLMPLGEVVPLTRAQCDLSRPETLPAIVNEIKPDVIVNAAAYTAVDKAEEEEELATIINGTSVGVLADEAKKRNALFVHYSTDYVFDGTKEEPYTEEDTPNPINAYGRSKLVGEEAIQQVGGKYFIFRTSWVYAARGHNFIKTILRLARDHDELKVVADQFGAPTSAELIADVTALIVFYLKNEIADIMQLYGKYHLTATEETSWHGYSQVVLAMAMKMGNSFRISPNQIIPIMTADYLLPAKRPANSRLDTNKLLSAFELQLPTWHLQVKRAVIEIIGK